MKRERVSGVVLCCWILFGASVAQPAEDDEQLAQSRTEYEEKTEALEKRFGDKASERAQAYYREEAGQAICRMIYALEWAADRANRAKKRDLMVARRKEIEALEEKLRGFHEKKTVILRTPRWIEWRALPEDGTVRFNEHLHFREFDEEAFLRKMNCERASSTAKAHNDKLEAADAGGEFTLHVDPTYHALHWFYLYAEKDTRARITVDLSKRDELQAIIVNIFDVHKKRNKVSARLRKGVNLVLVHFVGDKERKYSISMTVSGKGLLIGERQDWVKNWTDEGRNVPSAGKGK